LYFGAEDESAELHRRLARIVEHAGKSLADLDGVRLIPMAERDAVLAEGDMRGKKLVPTEIFKQLIEEATALSPKLVILDPSADVFGGDEINRSQVRQFVGMLRTFAINLDCAVLLLSHPSLTGINSGTGTSGSTAWSNSVRSRLYLEVPKSNGEPDSSARVLKVMKANYGSTGTKIKLRWHDGVYVVDNGDDPAVERLLHGKEDSLFLELLQLFAEQGQKLGIASGKSYAPAKMAKHQKAKGTSSKQLEAAMQRLLDAKRIRVHTEGSPSRQRSRLVMCDMETAE